MDLPNHDPKMIKHTLLATRYQKDRDIEQTAERTATPIVETVEAFEISSRKMSVKMIDAIERFEKSSKDVSNRMINLTQTMTYLTVAILLAAILTLGFVVIQVILTNDELINALRFSP